MNNGLDSCSQTRMVSVCLSTNSELVYNLSTAFAYYKRVEDQFTYRVKDVLFLDSLLLTVWSYSFIFY